MRGCTDERRRLRRNHARTAGAGFELRAGGAGRVAAIKAELRRGRRDGRQCDNAAPQKAVDLSADPPLTSAPMIKILILVVGRRVGKAV